MSVLRFNAIKESYLRPGITIKEEGSRSKSFGSHVFNEERMLQFLTKDALAKVEALAPH